MVMEKYVKHEISKIIGYPWKTFDEKIKYIKILCILYCYTKNSELKQLLLI